MRRGRFSNPEDAPKGPQLKQGASVPSSLPYLDVPPFFVPHGAQMRRIHMACFLEVEEYLQVFSTVTIVLHLQP